MTYFFTSLLLLSGIFAFRKITNRRFMRFIFLISLFICTELSFSQSKNSLGPSEQLYKDGYFVISSNTPFLFPKHLKGKLQATNMVIEDSSYLYNYDKLDKKVYVFFNNQVSKTVELGQVRSLEVFKNDKWYSYEPYFQIQKDDLFEVLVKRSDKYTLLKACSSQEGSQTLYYIIFPDQQVHSIKLNRKTVNTVLAQDPKSTYYIHQHKNDAVNEEYIVNFISYLNYF